MDLNLKGKTAVVTGASKGIGYAIAAQFLQEGANIAICARHKQELDFALDALNAPGRALGFCVDMACEDQVYAFGKAVCERFGQIDAWVNNVGAVVTKDGDEFTASDIDRAVGVCFKSALFGSQAAFRSMRHSGGAIVNISSLAARCPTAGRSSLYGPIKAAVVNLTQALAGEYAAYGVRVNCILTGFTLTQTVKDSICEPEFSRTIRQTLLQRGATPEEIAAPTVFLASDCASYITAETLEISGGRCRTLNPGYTLGDPQ